MWGGKQLDASLSPIAQLQTTEFFYDFKSDWFFRSIKDRKEQNKFQYGSGQIMEWLLGIVDINSWTGLLD